MMSAEDVLKAIDTGVVCLEGFGPPARFLRDARIAVAAMAEREAALVKEVEALRADAERYRWVRRIDSSPIHVFDLTSAETADASIYGKELDAAIDAARAEARDG